ncbi:MAG: hypothetical protein WAX55_02400, partial [Agathobacter rectalis]
FAGDPPGTHIRRPQGRVKGFKLQPEQAVGHVKPAKSPVVDLNNTNRNLTPDEIAALFKGH